MPSNALNVDRFQLAPALCQPIRNLVGVRVVYIFTSTNIIVYVDIFVDSTHGY